MRQFIQSEPMLTWETYSYSMLSVSMNAEELICDVACQNQGFVARMSCSVMMFFGKECNFSFHMIYYLCVYAFPVQSYAPRNKL